MTSERPAKDALGLRRLLWDLRHRRERFRQLLGVLFSVFVSLMGTPRQEIFWWGVGAAGLGILIRLWASGHVKKDRELATDGPYAYVRHPLYVGNILIGVGFCLASGLWWSGPLFIFFLLAFYPPAIRQEDAKLHGLFGESWERWSARTRALLPRLTPYQRSGVGHWSFGQSLKANGEPIIALFLLIWLYVLWYKLQLP